MASPRPPLLSWGIRLALVVAGTALLLSRFQNQLPFALSLAAIPSSLANILPSSLSSSSSAAAAAAADGAEGAEKTYCYDSVYLPHLTTGSVDDDGYKPNCFSVSTKTGRFTRVFSSKRSAAAAASSSDEVGAVKVKNEVTQQQQQRRRQRRGGQHVLPGLWDGHGHLIPYGEFLHSVNLFGCASFAEVRQRIRQYLSDKDAGVGSRQEWIRGVGWDQSLLGRMPTSLDLVLQKDDDPSGSDGDEDELRGKYVMLDRVDVHCTWVSEPVLELIRERNGDGRIPDDIEGGEIVRDPGMGVFCDNAMDLVTAVWDKPGKQRRKQWVRAAMKELNSVGLVGMHDAGVVPEDVRMYEEMVSGGGGGGGDDEKESWSVRVYAMYECPERNTFCPDLVKKIEGEQDGMLRVRSVKLFADGALGSWGSAMLDPYADKPETSGSLLVNTSTLTTLARQWSKAGYQVNIHAIGDRANRYAIDALEAGIRGLCDWTVPLKKCQDEELLFRIEHAQIIHPDDQERMKALGIIPSIQPTHATSDMAYAETRLGEERTRREAYRMRSLLDLQPILGSDFPVEPPNPFEGIYAAMTRRSPHTGVGPPGHEKGWHTEEALSLDQALNGFTRAPARGGFYGTTAGVIAEGAFADWVVLDEDITRIKDVEDIRKIKVRETWVGGRRVYARDDEEEEEEEEEEKEQVTREDL